MNIHPDKVSAWAVGVGIGWLSFMVTWIIMNRATAAVLDVPTAPIVAMATAIVVGLGVAVWQGKRLSRLTI